MTPRLLAVTTVRVDQRLLDDPTYVGKRFRGMAGFTEQAYLPSQPTQREFLQNSLPLPCLTTQHLEVTFGRDFLWWGPKRFGQLLLSTSSSPFSPLPSPPS